MKRFLYHDLIVAGNWCNLKCSYCTSITDAGDYGTETSASERRRGARKCPISIRPPRTRRSRIITTCGSNHKG